MKKIKAAVAGMGFIGTAHVEALKRLNNVEVAAICGSKRCTEAKAEELGVENYYSDYSEMLKNPEIDSVHICTPNYLHFQMAKDALNAGKHVICEKPLTTTKEEAEELAALAKEKGLINATNFNIRFYPLIHQLKAMVEKGDLGEIFSVNGSYLQDWLFYETDYNWRLEPELSGESRAIADIGSHWMDLIEFVTGLRATEVFADFATFHKVRKKPLKPVDTYSGKMLTSEDYQDVPINTEDYATVMIRFGNGARGVMTVSQVFAGKKNCLSFEIAGSKKSASWISEKPNEIWIGRRDTANESLLKDPSILYPEAGALVNYPGGHNEGFPDTFKQNFIKIYKAISENAGVVKEEYPTFEAGLREIILCEKIVESNKKGAWVKL
ncbi:Gfo/Idh/MocA family protein [Sinanaerobacter chloroacetimidivorans]|uniref:Gfo/Idh/MocA family oxidoreductase n=1 Tax=Sinanaerobacter chloroacetimidivorans TaxID=2818044 RepID=A0A8J7W1Q7_9FIRM|nr:Gfo/Idh/MocA family oxidoreductase [Sinanaerobacter chloroacetimidivorans]MBR0599262.1 Gfo/Idh/MocA family oxidoreductase [Sinanaerobacter chloroacetimidivorans]